MFCILMCKFYGKIYFLNSIWKNCPWQFFLKIAFKISVLNWFLELIDLIHLKSMLSCFRIYTFIKVTLLNSRRGDFYERAMRNMLINYQNWLSSFSFQIILFFLVTGWGLLPSWLPLIEGGKVWRRKDWLIDFDHLCYKEILHTYQKKQ